MMLVMFIATGFQYAPENNNIIQESSNPGEATGSDWDGWDLTNVPLPPELSNPVHYGGSGDAYPTTDPIVIDGGGGDILLENPADGQPLMNVQIVISNFRRVHIRGLHLKYDDKTFTWPCANRSEARAAAKILGSDACADTYGGPGPSAAQKRKIIFENPAWRTRSDWPDPGDNEESSPYQWHQKAIKIDATSGNEEVVYVEGMYFEDPTFVWHQGDCFALQNHGGQPYKFHMVNSRIDGVGIVGEDDSDVKENDCWIYRTIHADIVQTQGSQVKELQFWNNVLFGDYQGLFIPTNQNNYVYDFYFGRTLIGSRPGETNAPIIFLADGGQTPPPIKRWDDGWVVRDWESGGLGGNNNWRVLRPYSEEWFDSWPEPPWEETVTAAEAGDKRLRQRATDASDLPDFAPADKVGTNYVNPWLNTKKASFQIYQKKNGDVLPLEGATLKLNNYTRFTGADGKASIIGLTEGQYNYSVKKKVLRLFRILFPCYRTQLLPTRWK